MITSEKRPVTTRALPNDLFLNAITERVPPRSDRSEPAHIAVVLDEVFAATLRRTA